MARLLSDWFLQSGTPRHLVVPAPRPRPASWLIPAHYLFCYLTWVSLDAHGAICFYSGPLSVALMAQRACAPVYSVSDVFWPCLFLPPRHLCSTQPAPQPRHDSILIYMCILHLQSPQDQDPILLVPSAPISSSDVIPPSGLCLISCVFSPPSPLRLEPIPAGWTCPPRPPSLVSPLHPARALPACVFGSPSSPP